MIINYTPQGWEVITQRAHGLLAAQLAVHLKAANRPGRWTETLIAIAGHDDAQTELEETELLTPQGGPVNFAMKMYEPNRCKRALDFALSRSRYTALLQSMHLVFLYEKEAATNPQVKAFVNAQQKLQTQWCRALKINKKEAGAVYGLMEWCDAFSLLLCRQEVQPEERAIEISRGAGNQSMLKRLPDGSLTVSPWPFEDHDFEVHTETRIIPQLQFKNADDFKKAFLKAAVAEKRWKLKR